MPLGMLIFAPLADVIPIAWVFIAGGVLTLPVAWYVLSCCTSQPESLRQSR